MAIYKTTHQVECVQEYLTEHFSNQTMLVRSDGRETMSINLKDSMGFPKTLRISLEFLQTFNETTIREFLQNANIAQQIEDATATVSIVKPI